ncbi:helix-turn-helix domain-containing protein [Brevibacterium sp. K11IcPPYGO002]|uniref:helix-turn-helix domain-containing protein n=1 Tax=Brevibacterium sp. K11IcPPYGO002 TaxID=3058837 RepID=UPI003D81AFF5
MTAAASSERINISEETVEEARNFDVPNDASLAMRHSDGRTTELPSGIQEALLHALQGIAKHGAVSIGQLPAELTSTIAADLLSVSRPTLMKWTAQGRISSYKRGSHTRFHRDEVLDLIRSNAESRRDAFESLRQVDEEHEQFIDG